MGGGSLVIARCLETKVDKNVFAQFFVPLCLSVSKMSPEPLDKF